jgi:hypothetical protein
LLCQKNLSHTQNRPKKWLETDLKRRFSTNSHFGGDYWILSVSLIKSHIYYELKKCLTYKKCDIDYEFRCGIFISYDPEAFSQDSPNYPTLSSIMISGVSAITHTKQNLLLNLNCVV